ncbi:MAG: thiazole synthase [Kiritimatiellia bacterium]|nr:thiazole synthase [Lentisphaerota bacterium]
MPDDDLVIGDFRLSSRLLVGTGKFADAATMCAAVSASGARIVTVALRRFNSRRPAEDLLAGLAELPGLIIMPNTSGAANAAEAVKAAQIAREICGSPLVKLEIHPNPQHLMPDPLETFDAAVRLVRDGFQVMPYIAADPVLAKRLEEIGCVSVMPLGAGIGTGQGLATRGMLEIILRYSQVPVIVDAGLRAPSEAAAAMEMGCAAVLVNSAIAAAEDPPAMAAAFAAAVAAGRAAALAGLMPQSDKALPTSPLTAFLDHANTSAEITG